MRRIFVNTVSIWFGTGAESTQWCKLTYTAHASQGYEVHVYRVQCSTYIPPAKQTVQIWSPKYWLVRALWYTAFWKMHHHAPSCTIYFHQRVHRNKAHTALLSIKSWMFTWFYWSKYGLFRYTQRYDVPQFPSPQVPEASSKSSSPENPNTDHLSKLASYVTFSALNKP